MWIYVSSQIPEHLTADLRKQTVREDCTDQAWLNLDTGARIILACDGGWKEPLTARYKVLHYAPGENTSTDISINVAHLVNMNFDGELMGIERYRRPYREGRLAINTYLGVENTY